MVLDSSASARREAETAAVAQDCLPLRLRALLAFRPVEPLRRTSRRGPRFLRVLLPAQLASQTCRARRRWPNRDVGPQASRFQLRPLPALEQATLMRRSAYRRLPAPRVEQAPPIESPLRAGARNSPAGRRRADGAHGPGGRASAQSGGTCRRRSAAPANSPAHTAGGCRSSS